MNPTLRLAPLLIACGGPQPGAVDGLGSKADALMAQAKVLEPEVTPALKTLAADAGGEMVGLKYRFKSRKSLLRKMRKHRVEHPETAPADIVINDVLRYTMQVPDEPPGAHVRAIHHALATLEAAGHTVVKVKNYWPRGDNYSGVNTVLQAASGLPWELQFHTPASFGHNKKTHVLYEELREVDTPVERKRELFDEMAAPWEEIATPEGILEPKNLHARETIKKWDRP